MLKDQISIFMELTFRLSMEGPTEVQRRPKTVNGLNPGVSVVCVV